MISLVWLRRDLRLHDHAALAAALDRPEPVQPVFIFDTTILARFENPHDRRLTFIAETLCGLHASLKARGGRLWVLHGDAEKIIPKLSLYLKANVFAAQDFEPETRRRDKHVAAHAPLYVVKDHLIFSPKEVLKSDGTPFKVFTPYANAWRAKLTPMDYADYAINDHGRYATMAVPEEFKPLDMEKGAAALLKQIGYRPADISMWPVEGVGARCQKFVREKATAYPQTRDMMALDGTSRMSPYLRFGLVSIRELLRACVEQGHADTYIKELIWREFYAMILYHYPESANKEWNEKYRSIEWSRDAEKFSAWQQGKTGYPVVDAAMRQLLETGWMHNRARMIVASFLTKHLGIDWRLGEEHFAQHLMDYDMSSNVGGWQWSASTGTDAQPWFRIFSPLLQSQKFDPDGEYIRRYVPELSQVHGMEIHAPKIRSNYPAPIVDHASAREKALAMFKNI